MNRNGLIEMMAAVAAMAALGGCATTPTPQQAADMRQAAAKELGIARNAWAQCIRVAIPRVDDPLSSSETVAQAAMKGCADEYTAMVRAEASTLPPTCGRDPACTRGALATVQREATQAATDDVVDARVQAANMAALRCQ